MSNDISMSQNTDRIKKEKIDVFEGYDPEVKVRSKKMMMYLIIFAIVMIFAGFLSAYVVNFHGYDFWMHIPVPKMLWVSNGLLILTSIAAIMAHRSGKLANRKNLIIWLIVLFAIGVGFVGSQYAAFSDLASQNIVIAKSKLKQVTGEYGVDYYFTSGGEKILFDNGEYFMPDDKLMAKPINDKINNMVNLGGVYIHVLMIVHALHLLFALVYVIVNLFRASKGFFDNESNVISLYAQGLYWHFMGILWLVLFVFLFFFH